MKGKNILDMIKGDDKSRTDMILSFKTPEFRIPLKLTDRKAIQIIETITNDPEMENATVGDLHEVFEFAQFWLEFMQLVEYQDPEKRNEIRKRLKMDA